VTAYLPSPTVGVFTLGPLPIALGQPGVIPPRVANGCI